MPNTVREHPILTAVIGASGVIIAGILGYEGATGGFGKSGIDYTGVVRSLSRTPIPGAAVSIAEDQSVPQHMQTDSVGVFHARLHNTAVNVRLDVSADGYQPYTIFVQPSRTGSEEVFLNPIVPKASAAPKSERRSAQPGASTTGNSSPAISGSTVGDININSSPQPAVPKRR